MSVKGLVIANSTARGRATISRAPTLAGQAVANRPIIAHVVDAVRAAGAQEIAVVGTAEALEYIRSESYEPPVDVTYLVSPENASLCNVVASTAGFIRGDPCIVHVGEGLAGQPLPALATRPPETPDISLFVHHARRASYPVSDRLAKLLDIAELPGSRGRLAFAGVGFLGPGVLDASFVPAGTQHSDDRDFAVLGELVAEAGGRLSVGQLPAWCEYTGRPRELLELNRMVLDELEALPPIEEFEGNRFEGRLDIHPTAYISNSVIHGPVVIGERAEIVDAYVGPYTTIGRGVRLDGAEIERSIVYEGATILNLGVRVQDSTVGAHARIAREFGLPRALRVHVGEGVELALD